MPRMRTLATDTQTRKPDSLPRKFVATDTGTLATRTNPTQPMQIETYQNGLRFGVAVYDAYEMRRLDSVPDTIERLTGDRPWEAEDGTLSVEVKSEQEAKAVAAYLRAYYEWFLEPA